MIDCILTSSNDHVSTDEMSFVGHSPGSVVSPLQPTVFVVFVHCEGYTSSLSSAVVVTITESSTSEVPDVCTPVVNIIFNSS